LGKVKSALDNPEIYIYDDVDAEYIDNQILSGSIFSENRLFLLKKLPKFKMSDAKSNKRWIEVFDSIPEDSLVVIYGVEPKKASIIFKHVSKIGKTFHSPQKIKKGDAIRWLNDFLEEGGKEIDDDASDIIIESIGADSDGYDVDRLYISAKKISSYIGKRKKKVTKEDILCSADNYINFIIWDIISAFEAKDFNRCITLTHRACLKEKRYIDAVSQILNMILWKLRLVLFLKESVANGLSENAAINKAKELHKFSKSGAALSSIVEVEMNKTGGMKQLYSDNMISTIFRGFGGKRPSIECFGRSELFKLVVALNECMLNIRHESDDIHCMVIAENFFMEACRILSSQSLENVRRVPNGGIHSF